MTKNDLPFMPVFFDRYINQVEENEPITALEASFQRLTSLDLNQYKQLGNKVYQEGKWTIKDIFQHMADTERILSYRALRFARNDTKELQGFDEESYARHTRANERSLDDIVEEIILIRKTSLILFKNFDNEMLLRTGTANTVKLSVLALGFIIPGHQNHHLNIIKERYLPLLS